MNSDKHARLYYLTVLFGILLSFQPASFAFTTAYNGLFIAINCFLVLLMAIFAIYCVVSRKYQWAIGLTVIIVIIMLLTYYESIIFSSNRHY